MKKLVCTVKPALVTTSIQRLLGHVPIVALPCIFTDQDHFFWPKRGRLMQASLYSTLHNSRVAALSPDTRSPSITTYGVALVALAVKHTSVAMLGTSSLTETSGVVKNTPTTA